MRVREMPGGKRTSSATFSTPTLNLGRKGGASIVQGEVGLRSSGPLWVKWEEGLP